MKGYLQHDINDCGFACVATVCKMTGIRINVNDVRKHIFVGKDGLSLYGIVQIFNKLKIESVVMEGTFDEMKECFLKSRFPMIAIINKKEESHYVVIYKLNVTVQDTLFKNDIRMT